MDINTFVLNCKRYLYLQSRFSSISLTSNIMASFSQIPSRFAIIRHDVFMAINYSMIYQRLWTRASVKKLTIG